MNDFTSDLTSRTALLVGDEGVGRLRNASAAVAGIGGVGGYAVEALARAGVGSITIIDSDVVSPSNINRQIHALKTTAGQPKVSVMAERLLLINPDIHVNPIQMTITPDNLSGIPLPDFDIVLDAIDTFSAKLALLESCYRATVPVVSSMGAAGKLDPTRVTVGDISESHGCRLARKLRKQLRLAGINSGITVVYSDEPMDMNSIGKADDEGDSRRILGSISYMPAIFGMTMAGVAIRRILGLK